MAENFLRPVIDKLIKEAKSLKRVRTEVKSLQDELEIIEPFLRDAEAKSERGELSDTAKAWLKQIREQADRIVDVVDEYTYHVEVEQRHQQGGFFGALSKAGRLVKALKPRRDIACEIRDIAESLRNIRERGQSYGLRPFEQGCSSRTGTNLEATVDPRLGYLNVDEEELEGINSLSQELVRSLVEGSSSRAVISLIGEGGIGKTTLANRVYDDVAVKGHFDCRIWITVSQSYSIEKILNIMKSKICPTADQRSVGMIEEEIKLLRNSLQDRRYVLVFDDVWQTDFWGVIKNSLPRNQNGSRIIITTRNSAVADSFIETSRDIIRELKTWSPEQAWQLFCKKAFASEFGGHCPSELRQLSGEILSKCQGLPLVIAAVAGLLSKKEKTKSEWQRVLDNLNYEFEQNHDLANVSKILLLSYQDLPYYLKPCFLYFGIFPEDSRIYEDGLRELWIAEGFIKPERNMTLEQVAEKYLNELVCRNLVSFEIQNLGYQRWFCVHDLMRDIILTKADELCFFQTVNENKLGCRHNRSHRLSIHNAANDASEIFGNSRVRTVFLFNISELHSSFLTTLFRSFKLLRVLDFEDSPLAHLPKEVGNLVHLKSLNLRRTNVENLPKSIGKLHNLQRLDVYDTFVRELPVEINKLTKLRSLQAYCRLDHTIGGYAYAGARIQEGIGCLEELQKLDTIEAYPAGVGLTKGLERLRKLKVLSISSMTAEIGKSLGASLEKMDHLDKLCLTFVSEDETLDLKCMYPPPSLRYLKLSCRLQEFSDFAAALQKLQGLRLEFSSLTDEALKCLASLPVLAHLYMYQAYDGEELLFEEGSFKKLKQLYLRGLEGLKVVKIDKGALTSLEDLQLGPLPLMTEMPSDIQHLTNLKLLGLKEMRREFVLGLQPNGGPDYWKIQHIPSVAIWYKSKGFGYRFYNLGSSDLLQRLV